MLPLDAYPLVMGIVNVTPDSFSDGGRFLDPAAAIAHGHQLFDEGADIVDVGGQSTRPGAEPLAEDAESSRVLPVVEALADRGRVSIDTTGPGVATAAVAAGATLINDVSASMWTTAADLGVGWVAMHMQGDPATMQADPSYDDVVAEVIDHLTTRADAARVAGVGEIWIDPGIGFGKTRAHNLSLLKHLPRLVDTGWPVLVGTSRKSFLGAVLAASDGVDDVSEVPPDDRLEGSVATATWAATVGAQMVRVHDVSATVQALRVVAA